MSNARKDVHRRSPFILCLQDTSAQKKSSRSLMPRFSLRNAWPFSPSGPRAKLGTRTAPSKERLGNAPVEVSVRGILPADEVVRSLGSCDVMLFVRGAISTRRGSAIAGIACGLPVIGCQGWETASPLTKAGVVLAQPHEPNNFGSALVRVLSDSSLRAELAKQSREAYSCYFSWDVIAAQFVEAMRGHGAKPHAQNNHSEHATSAGASGHPEH